MQWTDYPAQSHVSQFSKLRAQKPRRLKLARTSRAQGFELAPSTAPNAITPNKLPFVDDPMKSDDGGGSLAKLHSDEGTAASAFQLNRWRKMIASFHRGRAGASQAYGWSQGRKMGWRGRGALLAFGSRVAVK